jgi:hydroxymethylbilane synthase
MPNLYQIATRGSALALTQSNQIRQRCRSAFPNLQFELNVIKTTGDKLQTVSTADAPQTLPKGLFTKELEVALLDGKADFAVHSLKDLPTELPAGLELSAVPEREDPRDVLLYHAERGKLSSFRDLPRNALVATSSTRRQAQLRDARPDIQLTTIRGNVGTRLEKLARSAELHGIILALAGLKRLGFTIAENTLQGPGVPAGVAAIVLSTQDMLPCVGQAALGIESRTGDERMVKIRRLLNHQSTMQCVLAERAFLRGMGGGCLSPVGALATLEDGALRLQAISFRDGGPKRGVLTGQPDEAESLGLEMARQLSGA